MKVHTTADIKNEEFVVKKGYYRILCHRSIEIITTYDNHTDNNDHETGKDWVSRYTFFLRSTLR